MTSNTFAGFNLQPEILQAISELGYEAPSPIQQESIPLLSQGHDLLAQAQTGTGKTAAFALPLLNQIDLSENTPQALILAPTRELAVQISEAFQSYAKYLPNFHVLPIYGGQEFRGQLRALKRGVQVIVGTPGRVMDHLRRKTLRTDSLKTVILDEADEMLKMGFIEDVQWILQQIPNQHQTGLFSATVPPSIKKIADQYLKQAKHVQIKAKTESIGTIDQQYMITTRHHKLDALTHYLELENADGVIVFAKTKVMTVELAEKLEARGYAAAAMNGDMNQTLREQVIQRLKTGRLDIVIATDVAARGIDVSRISHVINFDIPHDSESYVHRIGRTGRAGRQGKALLLVSPRERRLLKELEYATKQSINVVKPASAQELTLKRSENFANKILKTLSDTRLDLNYQQELIEQICHDSEHSALEIAAALAHLVCKRKPLQVTDSALRGLKPMEFESGGQRHRRSHSSGGNKRRRSNGDHRFKERRGRSSRR